MFTVLTITRYIMVKLVCIDIDGTLVGASGEVQGRVWDTVEEARSRGVRLAICSGRPAFGLAREYATRLDERGWHVFQNGASVIRVDTGESRSRCLSTAAVERLVSTTREVGRVLELYTDTDYAVESECERARGHARLLGVPFRTREFASLAGPIVRAQWLLSRDEAEPVLTESHEELALSVSHSPVLPDTAFLDMTSPGVDKASAVRLLADAYGVPLEQVMMVGDGYNDTGVMKIVGHPVAMGNAEAPIHAVARYSVAGVDECGLAEALELAMRLAFSAAPGSAAA
jgi:Cof subfamily protein (haloacid dehalogenase superfamily)